MKIINAKADIDALPPAEKSVWLTRLAATIHRENEDGSVTTDISTIEHFGYALEDFPDAPVAPYTPPPEPEPEPVPEEVTRRQLLLVLASQDPPVTRAAIRTMLTGNELALIEFDEAMTFRRDHPLVLALAQQIGLTAAQVDAIFQAAALEL